MDRRRMIAGAAVSALAGSAAGQAVSTQQAVGRRAVLEWKTWRLHNSEENQSRRVSEYLERGFFPAMSKAGARPLAALGNLIGPDGPYLATLTQFNSLAAMDDALLKVEQDVEHEQALRTLSAGLVPGAGAPFVRVESSLLRCFSGFPQVMLPPPPPADRRGGRVLELRIYESQSPTALRTKISMFEGGEIGIFQRLGMRPVFFGETIVGTRMPCIAYMLSFDSLAERERLWAAFVEDAEWKRISAPPQLKDAQIVGNISNVMLRALPFSPLQ